MDRQNIEFAEMQLAMTTAAVAVINAGIQVLMSGQGIQVPGRMEDAQKVYMQSVGIFNQTCAGISGRLEELRGPQPVEEMQAELELCKS